MDSLSNFSTWLDKSSQARPTPNSARPPVRGWLGQRIVHPVQMMALGRYAEIAPHDLSEPPIVDFHEHALVFHVSLEQAAGLSLPPTMDTGEPVGQPRAFERLWHIAGKMADAAMGLPATWRTPDGWERRPCAIFPLFSPDTPVADQIAAQMPMGVDLAGVAVLAVPVFKFGKKERVQIGHRLPFIPT